jgi:hypothetical protein
LAETVLAHIEPAVRSSRGALLLNGRALASRHMMPMEFETWTKTWSPADETGLDCDVEVRDVARRGWWRLRPELGLAAEDEA